MGGMIVERVSGCGLKVTQNRELSWLKFNERVLSMAEDADTPLAERLRFLSIFGRNLDEFFSVRVARLLNLARTAPDRAEGKGGMTPAEQLERIDAAVRALTARRDACYQAVAEELRRAGIEEASAADGGFDRAFDEQIRPLLVPRWVEEGEPRGGALCVAALVSRRGRTRLGIVEIPTDAPRVLRLPGAGCARVEEVVLARLARIFTGSTVEEAAVISVTRGANLPWERTFGADAVRRLLCLRERQPAVRLEIQGHAPRLAEQLAETLHLPPEQVYRCACPLRLDADGLENCPAALLYPPNPPAREDGLTWERVRAGDVLLCHPHQSMEPLIRFLRRSAEDPQVESIQISLYRLAGNSAVGEALCAAARNGKRVGVIMELRARFDERNNLAWARRLERAGCRVCYGSERWKCHAKLCLIVRREPDGQTCVTQIGTGNYNEETARQYTDFSLLTADPAIARDARRFFQSMETGVIPDACERLMVAPNSLRKRLEQLIDEEIAQGESGRIRVKVNAVTDCALMDKLCEASRAGVRVELIVRGICCLLPGVEGRTENIAVTSIVGRFLEHSRVYCFGEGERRRCYLSSADWMTRNQSRRVEIACPVEDPKLADELWAYLDRLTADNVNAWRMQPDGGYRRVRPEGEPPVDSQRAPCGDGGSVV